MIFYSLLIISLFDLTFGLDDQWPKFALFTQKNINLEAIYLNSTNLNNTDFNHNLRTYLIIHGFLDSGNAEWALYLKNKLLLNENSNVLIVDWKEGAKILLPGSYYQAVQNSKALGALVYKFLNSLDIRFNKIHCIGHSLGAHSCGLLGESIETPNKLYRITGLDPPKFLFDFDKTNERLDKQDAKLVDVIHTDWKFGINLSIGHKDFWPNRNKEQPGCSFDYIHRIGVYGIIFCSHMRAIEYYVESIGSLNSFKASNNCQNSWLSGDCNCSTNCPRMGHYAFLNNKKGDFYLTTDSKKPYSK